VCLISNALCHENILASGSMAYLILVTFLWKLLVTWTFRMQRCKECMGALYVSVRIRPLQSYYYKQCCKIHSFSQMCERCYSQPVSNSWYLRKAHGFPAEYLCFAWSYLALVIILFLKCSSRLFIYTVLLDLYLLYTWGSACLQSCHNLITSSTEEINIQVSRSPYNKNFSCK
jgi:hypothetical protein